jgi:SAM-dependent methyltransferase
VGEHDQEILDRHRMLWSLGNYERVAHFLRPASLEVVKVCNVGPGTRFLDVGAGTGNTAIEAARAGAEVIATDLTPHLIEIGKALSEREGLSIEWREADAQNLPFEDDSFDVVASTFGAMFAPDADATVREMLRVAKPGGSTAFTSWASDGMTGQTLALSSSFMPPPPEDVDTVGEWGDEETARTRFSKHAADVKVHRGSVTWSFPTREEATRFWEEDAAPGVAAKMMLPEDRFAELRAKIEEIQENFNRGSGEEVVYDSDFLLTVARKA